MVILHIHGPLDEGMMMDEGTVTDEGAVTDEGVVTDEGAVTDEGMVTDEGAVSRIITASSLHFKEHTTYCFRLSMATGA